MRHRTECSRVSLPARLARLCERTRGPPSPAFGPRLPPRRTIDGSGPDLAPRSHSRCRAGERPFARTVRKCRAAPFGVVTPLAPPQLAARHRLHPGRASSERERRGLPRDLHTGSTGRSHRREHCPLSRVARRAPSETPLGDGGRIDEGWKARGEREHVRQIDDRIPRNKVGKREGEVASGERLVSAAEPLKSCSDTFSRAQLL